MCCIRRLKGSLKKWNGAKQQLQGQWKLLELSHCNVFILLKVFWWIISSFNCQWHWSKWCALNSKVYSLSSRIRCFKISLRCNLHINHLQGVNKNIQWVKVGKHHGAKKLLQKNWNTVISTWGVSQTGTSVNLTQSHEVAKGTRQIIRDYFSSIHFSKLDHLTEGTLEQGNY